MTTWTIFAWILIFNAFISLGLAWRIGARKLRKAGNRSLVWMLLALVIWSFSYAMINLSPATETKIFWLKLENIGIVLTPTLWFIFASRYTKQDKWLNEKVAVLLLFIPLISLALIFSDHLTHLYYSAITPLHLGNVGPLNIEGGPWYTVQLVQSYLTIGAGILLLIWHLMVFKDIYQGRILSILAALAAPVGLNTFYHMGKSYFPEIYIDVDLTPIAFTISASLINFAVYQQELFEMSPVARQLALDNVVEKVLIIDENDLIVDINHPALLWLQKDSEKLIGKEISILFDECVQLGEYYQRKAAQKHSFTITTDKDQHIMEVTISPIYNRLGNLEGRVFVAHDRTERKALEDELAATKKALKELEEKSRKTPL